MNTNENEYSPNVKLIRDQGVRIVRATIFHAVRNELMRAVKSGSLGRLKKDGLKPEIFYHPNHEQEARESQINEALHSIECISRIVYRENI